MAEKSKEKKIKTTPIKVVVDGNEYTIIGGDKKFRKNMRATQLEYNLDKQGYKGTPEKESNSKVNPIDNANRIRAGLKKGGRAGYQGGGRTNLLEELGRVEGESSNRNRRAEVSRIHGELNRGYSKGGRTGLKHGGAAKRGRGCEIKS